MMRSRFAKILVGLAVLGGTVGVGVGVGSAISSAATSGSSSTTTPRFPSITAPCTNHHCPNMGGSTTSGAAAY
jgi:hypothetical protein